MLTLIILYLLIGLGIAFAQEELTGFNTSTALAVVKAPIAALKRHAS